jgi:hypothetical protein
MPCRLNQTASAASAASSLHADPDSRSDVDGADHPTHRTKEPDMRQPDPELTAKIPQTVAETDRRLRERGAR